MCAWLVNEGCRQLITLARSRTPPSSLLVLEWEVTTGVRGCGETGKDDEQRTFACRPVKTSKIIKLLWWEDEGAGLGGQGR